MMHRFRMQRFKGHTDTTVELGRLTMLVGDNASGKTSVLQALEMQAQVVVGGRLAEDPRARVQRGATEGMVLESVGDTSDRPWSLTTDVDGASDKIAIAMKLGATRPGLVTFRQAFKRERDGTLVGPNPNEKLVSRAEVTAAIGDARLFRFDGEAIAKPSLANATKRVAANGTGTARVLAALRLADDGAFDSIQEAARVIVPSLRAIRVEDQVVPSDTDDEGGKAIYRIRLSFDGCDNIPASEASQGTLVTLALLTVLYGPDRPRLIMLDDFDHALHPRAQMELVRTLRRLLERPDFTELQIIATTHSPYVLDELAPSEVQVFALRPDGTVASKRLSEHPEAQKSPGSLRTGELWTLDAERDWVLKG